MYSPDLQRPPERPLTSASAFLRSQRTCTTATRHQRGDAFANFFDCIDEVGERHDAQIRTEERNPMSCIYLPWNASNARQRDAERARQNRAEIVRELSWGRVSRRDLIKMGLFTGAGMLARVGGLNPFVATASARSDDNPTGAPRSPLFGAKPFTQPMPRLDCLPRNPLSGLTPYPEAYANQILMPVDPLLGG